MAAGCRATARVFILEPSPWKRNPSAHQPGGFILGAQRGSILVSADVLTAVLFIVMLKDLMKGRKKPVMLVVDGLPVHKAKSVAQYVQSTKGRLELHFLPPYAPDLNPDEFVWSHLKQNGTSKKPLHKNEALRQRVETDLAGIKQDRKLVRSFFKAPTVSYAIY